MAEFTNVRDLSQFEFCPLCGEELEEEIVPEGNGERMRVFCPEHDLLVFPHTQLEWPNGGRKPGEERSRWADGRMPGGNGE